MAGGRPTRAVAALAACLLALALAACSGDDDAQAPATAADTSASAPAPPAPPAPQPEGPTVRVVDGDSDEPLVGARVQARGPEVAEELSVGADGTVTVPPGTRLVRARAAGHDEVRAAVRRRGTTTIELYDPRLQSPQYGGDERRTRAVPEVRMPPPRGEPAWSFDGRTLIEFPPAVKDGVAVFGVNSGRVFALDVDTGGVIWAKRQESYIAATPAIVDGRVYVASMDGLLSVYRLADGKKLWEFSTDGSPIETSPLVVGDELYIGTWGGRLYSLDIRTRQLRWTFQAPDDIKGSAVAVGDTVVVGDYSGNLHALGRSDGAEVWTYTGGARFYGGPGLSDGTLVVGDVGGAVIAVDAASGAERWRFSTGGAFVYASPAIADGTVYIGSYDQSLYALDLQTGAQRWRFNAGARISGSATVVDGVVYTSVLYLPGQPKRTYGLDAQTGAVRFESDDGRYSPAVAAGRTLFLVGSRTLYAYPARGR